MTPAPGTYAQIIDSPPTPSSPTDTDAWFVTGQTLRGAAGVALGPFHSLAEAAASVGGRSGVNIALYDALDTFFHEGGSRVYISRVAGAGLLTAALNLLDVGGAVSLIATALSPGAWGNGAAGGIQLQVQTNADDATIPAGQYKIVVTYGGVAVEWGGPFADQASAISWATTSAYIRLALGASANLPTRLAAVTSLAGGADGAAPAEADWTAALAAFAKDLGPGQVSAPGRTTDAAHQALRDHLPGLRVAYCDGVDTADVPTLVASAGAIRGDVAHADRFTGAFAPWVKIPGTAPLPNITRTAPPSAFAAGLTARNDTAGASPGQPPAGPNGVAQYAIGLSQPAWTASQRDQLNQAGVNVIRIKYSVVMLYGFRSCANPASDPEWVELNWGRLAMAMMTIGQIILDGKEFDLVDGAGRLFAELKGELVGAYLPFFSDGSLYGTTPDEAFSVDTGPSVNTPVTIANKEIHAAVKARFSPAVEVGYFQLSKVPTTQEII